MKKTLQQSNKNRVMGDDFRSSNNFFTSDLILRDYLDRKISRQAGDYMSEKLEALGKKAALAMDALSLQADKNGPELVKRNFWGEDIDELRFHPAYKELMKIAVDSEMFTVKWKPELREKYGPERHRLGFMAGYLYAMGELGLYCPLCMTDGVARLIDRHCTDEERSRLLPHIYTSHIEELYTGAMFLTEKAGGSDVGRNIVSATRQNNGTYKLNGEKWFCSNVNAELIFALARTDATVKGTSGLSIFLIEKHLKDGSKNHLPIIRLKEKLGVRSMASAECEMDNTEATLVGEEFGGFKIMTDMINLSRVYNAVAALAGSRRALVEAYTFTRFRRSFGKTLIEHALVRDKLFELGSLNVANFYLAWRAVEALDAADNGDKEAAGLARLLTPMTKKWSAETAVYISRESMELMGGIGYIEDGVMPKIIRDLMVLPIWEGAGNIMILDMLRASAKAECLQVMFEEIERSMGRLPEFDDTLKNSLKACQKHAKQLGNLKGDELELSGKKFFEQLTTLFQLSVVLEETTKHNADWMNPAARFLQSKIRGTQVGLQTTGSIKALIGWRL